MFSTNFLMPKSKHQSELTQIELQEFQLNHAPVVRLAKMSSPTRSKSKSKGPTNPAQAEQYATELTEMVTVFTTTMSTRNAKADGVYKLFIIQMKEHISVLVNLVKEADPEKILATITDINCEILRSQIVGKRGARLDTSGDDTDEDTILNELGKQIPRETKGHVRSMFEYLGEAHAASASACKLMVKVADQLPPAQLMKILDFATRPLVSLHIPRDLIPTTLEGPAAARQRREVSIITQVLPAPGAAYEKQDGTTLLAATIYHKLIDVLFHRSKQDDTCGLFKVGKSQFKRCLSGAKYEGGRQTVSPEKIKDESAHSAGSTADSATDAKNGQSSRSKTKENTSKPTKTIKDEPAETVELDSNRKDVIGSVSMKTSDKKGFTLKNVDDKKRGHSDHISKSEKKIKITTKGGRSKSQSSEMKKLVNKRRAKKKKEISSESEGYTEGDASSQDSIASTESDKNDPSYKTPALRGRRSQRI